MDGGRPQVRGCSQGADTTHHPCEPRPAPPHPREPQPAPDALGVGVALREVGARECVRDGGRLAHHVTKLACTCVRGYEPSHTRTHVCTCTCAVGVGERLEPGQATCDVLCVRGWVGWACVLGARPRGCREGGAGRAMVADSRITSPSWPVRACVGGCTCAFAGGWGGRASGVCKQVTTPVKIKNKHFGPPMTIGGCKRM